MSDAHSKSLMFSQPAVMTPVLSLSRTHSHAYLKSSQVRGSPSDHLRPSRSFQVTVIASPFWPTVTPPLAVVGIGSAASCGMYRKSSLIVSRVCQTDEATLASVTWVR